LQPGNLEPLPAAQILAAHHVVFAQHVGPRFGESGAIAFVGASGQLALLGAHQPSNFIVSSFVTMRTVQCRRFLFWPLVKEISFVHKAAFSRQLSAFSAGQLRLRQLCHKLELAIHFQQVSKRKKTKTFTAVQEVKAMARERIGAPPPEQVVPDRKKKKKASEKHKPTLVRLLQENE
jgi:hypothetical protein